MFDLFAEVFHRAVGPQQNLGSPEKNHGFLGKNGMCVQNKKKNVAQKVAVISDLATQDGHIDQELLGYDLRKCADNLKNENGEFNPTMMRHKHCRDLQLFDVRDFDLGN